MNRNDRTETAEQSHFAPLNSGILFLVSILLLLTGCVNPRKVVETPVTLRCKVPTITRLPETKESQEKGGLEIAVVPALYRPVTSKTVTMTQAQAPFDPGQILINTEAGKIYVEEITTPELKTAPERLEFSVRVNNKLDRVFRGQGSVVQFNVGGKLIPFDQTNYRAFIGGIVPPRNETNLKIYGPPFAEMENKGTIGVFLYDVVTATDVAGKVTEKQNYEWYFNYTVQEKEQSDKIVSISDFISISDFQRRSIAEQQQKAQEQMREMQNRIQLPQ